MNENLHEMYKIGPQYAVITEMVVRKSTHAITLQIK